MSILDPLKAHQVFQYYTHEGWLGLCPVYYNERDGDVHERNGIPEAWLFVNCLLVQVFMLARSALTGVPLPGWPVLVGKRIGHGGGAR